MKTTLNPETAKELLKAYVKRANLYKHCLATGAVMRALAERLGEDAELWHLVGLLHDLDVELTSPEEHTQRTAEILEGYGLPQYAIKAIRAHNDLSGVPREDKLSHALAAADNVTGLIVASALVLPDRKLSSLTLKSLRKRFKEKRFAAGAKRSSIMECEEIGLTLDEFLELALKAMQGIAGELGL